MQRRAFLRQAAALSVGWAAHYRAPAARLAAGALSLGATAPQPAMGAPRSGGTLRVSVSRVPNNLNPLRHGNQSEYMLGEMFYSNLVRLADDSTPIPDLAEAWSSNHALTEWTFRLRKGVRFQHGPELTADDVAATFRQLLRKETLSPARRNVGPIDTVAVLDRHTIRFNLSMPYGDQAVALAYPTAKILPAHILESDSRRLDKKCLGPVLFDCLHTTRPGSSSRSGTPTISSKDVPTSRA